MTRYAYDAHTFQVKRQVTEKYTQTDYTFSPQSGTKKQDTAYNYDLAGNILDILERSTDCGIQGSTFFAMVRVSRNNFVNLSVV